MTRNKPTRPTLGGAENSKKHDDFDSKWKGIAGIRHFAIYPDVGFAKRCNCILLGEYHCDSARTCNGFVGTAEFVKAIAERSDVKHVNLYVERDAIDPEFARNHENSISQLTVKFGTDYHPKVTLTAIEAREDMKQLDLYRMFTIQCDGEKSKLSDNRKEYFSEHLVPLFDLTFDQFMAKIIDFDDLGSKSFLVKCIKNIDARAIMEQYIAYHKTVWKPELEQLLEEIRPFKLKKGGPIPDKCNTIIHDIINFLFYVTCDLLDLSFFCRIADSSREKGVLNILSAGAFHTSNISKFLSRSLQAEAIIDKYNFRQTCLTTPPLQALVTECLGKI